MSDGVVRVGVLGCGNVGAALVTLVAERADAIAARTGVRLEVTRVAVHNPAKVRDAVLAAGVLTGDADAVVADPNIDVVVELIGGIEPARALTLAALVAGKPVVTGNKELLANMGAELFAAADAAGRDLLFEAAVAGAIPLVRVLRESLVGEPLRRVVGIVNGTTNFVLSRMTEADTSYAHALAEAQRLGFAERDPTADVEGHDAAAKAAVMASVAFGVAVVAGDVYREGISGITDADISDARRLGYVVKLLAIAERADDGEVSVRVHPAMVPVDHPLATVSGSYNAVFCEGDAAGQLMLYGRGAGGRPTASAVLGDLVEAATNLRKGTHSSLGRLGPARIRPIDDTCSEFALTVQTSDEPGVLAAVAGVFGAHAVSIRSMEQVGLGAEARLVFITHEAREAAMQATVEDLRHLPSVRRVGDLVRVVGAAG